MERIIRTLRRTIRPNYALAGLQFRSVDIFYTNCTWIIRSFYVVSLIFSYGLISAISLKDPGSADFLWPVAWLEIGNLGRYFVAIPIVLFALNCAVVLRPELRVLRILFAVFCLFSAAIDISYGAINHGWHIWIWISVMLIFLPGHRGVHDRAHKLTTLMVMVYTQAMILLFYSMAGSLKLMAGIKSLIAGEMGNFSPLGFSSLLADRMMQGRGVTILGDYFITHAYVAYPFFLALIVVQALSFPAAFFPRLHRSLGLTLIAFHLGTGLLMDIYFPAHVLWLALFLVCSPFRINRGRWRGIARSWFE